MTHSRMSKIRPIFLCLFVAALLGFARAASAVEFVLQVEIIDVPKPEVQELLFDRVFASDMTPLRKEVQALVRLGKATMIESVILTLSGGQRAKTTSIGEKMYTTEYQHDKWKAVGIFGAEDGSADRLPPESYMFDVCDIGSVAEAELTEAGDGVIRCSLQIGITRYHGHRSYTSAISSQGKTVRLHPHRTLDQPLLSHSSTSTVIESRPGTYILVSQKNSQDDRERSRLTFVRIDCLDPEPKIQNLPGDRHSRWEYPHHQTAEVLQHPPAIGTHAPGRRIPPAGERLTT